MSSAFEKQTLPVKLEGGWGEGVPYESEGASTLEKYNYKSSL